MRSMRLLLTELAFVALAAPVFGQTAPPVTLRLPVLPPLPRPYIVNAPPASAPALTPPGEGLPFHHWRDLLTKSDPMAVPGSIYLKRDLMASALGAPDHCSIPLIEIPLPAHYDDGMVRKMGPHPDDRMAMATPPVCALHSAPGKPSKRR